MKPPLSDSEGEAVGSAAPLADDDGEPDVKAITAIVVPKREVAWQILAQIGRAHV